MDRRGGARADDRAHVARIGDRIEHNEKRLRALGNREQWHLENSEHTLRRFCLGDEVKEPSVEHARAIGRNAAEGYVFALPQDKPTQVSASPDGVRYRAFAFNKKRSLRLAMFTQSKRAQ